jgi:uncharacterized protein DUF4145
VMICKYCDRPTYITTENQCFPAEPPGEDIPSLPENVAELHFQARASLYSGAPVACVMVCRTLLMHLAVNEGAPEGKNFVEYVNWLETNGYCPPKGRSWVDFIRQKGNQANHEIPLLTVEDAALVLKFTESLLRHAYDLPSQLPQ